MEIKTAIFKKDINEIVLKLAGFKNANVCEISP